MRAQKRNLVCLRFIQILRTMEYLIEDVKRGMRPILFLVSFTGPWSFKHLPSNAHMLRILVSLLSLVCVHPVLPEDMRPELDSMVQCMKKACSDKSLDKECKTFTQTIMDLDKKLVALWKDHESSGPRKVHIRSLVDDTTQGDTVADETGGITCECFRDTGKSIGAFCSAAYEAVTAGFATTWGVLSRVCKYVAPLSALFNFAAMDYVIRSYIRNSAFPIELSYPGWSAQAGAAIRDSVVVVIPGYSIGYCIYSCRKNRAERSGTSAIHPSSDRR